jgi:hypothetical protein
MATKTDVKTETNDDPVASMRMGIDKMKAEADKLGVAQWRALRSLRKDIGALIKQIESR